MFTKNLNWISFSIISTLIETDQPWFFPHFRANVPSSSQYHLSKFPPFFVIVPLPNSEFLRRSQTPFWPVGHSQRPWWPSVSSEVHKKFPFNCLKAEGCVCYIVSAPGQNQGAKSQRVHHGFSSLGMHFWQAPCMNVPFWCFASRVNRSIKHFSTFFKTQCHDMGLIKEITIVAASYKAKLG